MHSISIGNQIWQSANLNVDRFRNGDLIKEARSLEEWISAGKNQQAAWCYFKNDASKGAVYGKLYNWYVVKDSRGIAPQGWHIPSDAEWINLTDNLGSKAGEGLKSADNWNGNNETGFGAIPAGYRDLINDFSSENTDTFWWTITPKLTYDAWSRHLCSDNHIIGRQFNYMGNGFSIRCVKD